jgi:hypothetical protein
MDVDADGRVFATYGTNDCLVLAYDSAAKLVPFERQAKNKIEGIKEEIPVAIDGVTGYGGSLRLDRAGNIYLLQAGMPKGHQAPAGFEKDEAYKQALGTIYKFGPKGGEVKQTNGVVKEVIGSSQAYPGCGPVSRWNAVGSCACTKPRFDVDDYGRLFIPNAITFSVTIVDNAGNKLAQFGQYGNFDSQGPGSTIPTPEIPLGWPVAVGASEKSIYTADTLNHRLVRTDFQYQKEVKLKVEKK